MNYSLQQDDFSVVSVAQNSICLFGSTFYVWFGLIFAFIQQILVSQSRIYTNNIAVTVDSHSIPPARE